MLESFQQYFGPPLIPNNYLEHHHLSSWAVTRKQAAIYISYCFGTGIWKSLDKHALTLLICPPKWMVFSVGHCRVSNVYTPRRCLIFGPRCLYNHLSGGLRYFFIALIRGKSPLLPSIFGGRHVLIYFTVKPELSPL